MKTKIAKKKTSRLKEKIKNVTVIIVYHTFVARMKSFGPTALIPFKRKKLIDKQIEIIEKIFDKSNIIIAAGYGAYEIYKHIEEKYPESNIRVVENSNFNQSSPSETISLALNNTNNNNIFIIDGSLILEENAIRKINFNKNCTIFYDNNKSLDDAGLNVNEENKVEHFSFGASKGWSELIFLKYRRDINQLRDKLSHPINRKKFVFEILNNMIQFENMKIHGIANSSEMLKINNLYTYKEIERKK